MGARSRGKDTELAKEQARKDRTGQEGGIEEKELINGRVVEELTEEGKDVKGLQAQQT